MFRFSSKSDCTILSTCFGVQLLYLLGELEKAETSRIENALHASQGEDGFFVDQLMRREDLSGDQDNHYLSWQTTFFAVIALDMLGKKPNHDLAFLDSYGDAEVRRGWLEARNWGNFWYSSNEIMFILYLMTFRGMRNEAMCILSWMDEHQSEATGFWGEGDARNQLFGAAHILLFYEFYSRAIPRPAQMLDTTRSLADAAGLYGGACEDYDAVDVICRARSWMLEDADKEFLSRMRKAISSAQRADGGFPYRIAPPGVKEQLSRFLSKMTGNDRYRYSGWKKMSACVNESDMWGTYFRVLTIAMIDEALGQKAGLCGYSLPGWGYIRSAEKMETRV